MPAAAVHFLLDTPSAEQHLEFRKLASAGDIMGAPTGAPAEVSCRPYSTAGAENLGL